GNLLAHPPPVPREGLMIAQHGDAIGVPGQHPAAHLLVPEDRGLLTEPRVHRVRVRQRLRIQRVIVDTRRVVRTHRCPPWETALHAAAWPDPESARGGASASSRDPALARRAQWS